MLVEEFSSGYYSTEVYVEPGEGAPSINDSDYRDLLYEVFPPGEHEGMILFQLDEHFFPIEPSRGVATNVLELPEEVMEVTRVNRPPQARMVLVPKPWFAESMCQQFTQGRSYQRE